MTDGATSTEQTHYLNKEEEFRIEVKIGTSVRVTLTDGTAEVFGAELPKGTPVELPGGKHAIFSWHGATIDVSGPTELEYVARDTPMAQYLNLDGVLEERRKAAAAASAAGDAGFASDGPRVALVGPTDVGQIIRGEDPNKLRGPQGMGAAVRGPRPGPRRHHVPGDDRRGPSGQADRRARGCPAGDAARVLPRRRVTLGTIPICTDTWWSGWRRCWTRGTRPTRRRAPRGW
jgi:hypothetical protein